MQQLEGDRPTSQTKSFKSASTHSIRSTKKTGTEQSSSILPIYKNKKFTTHNNNHNIKERHKNDQKTEIKTIINGKIKPNNNHYKNHILDTSIEEEDNNQEPTKVWHTGFTNTHGRIKRISKRSQHATEDLQQEQLLQHPIIHRRQVLPNIQLMSKSKHVHKGLTYKESQKLPRNANDLSDYTLTQANTRHEINAARVKQKRQQLPPITATATTMKNQQSQLHVPFDLHETRKRIIKGSTVACRTPPQSMAWLQNQGDNGSILNSQISLPIQTLSPFNHAALSFIPQKHKAIHTTPNISQYFEISSTNNHINIPT